MDCCKYFLAVQSFACTSNKAISPRLFNVSKTQPKNRGPPPPQFRQQTSVAAFIVSLVHPYDLHDHTHKTCYRYRNTFFLGHMNSRPAIRSGCFVCGLIDHQIRTHSLPFSSAENFLGGNQRKGSFITSSAKNTLICSWTVSFLESTGTKTGTKPDPTAGFSEKKPQEIFAAYAGVFFCVFVWQCKVHLAQNKNFSKRHRVKE